MSNLHADGIHQLNKLLDRAETDQQRDARPAVHALLCDRCGRHPEPVALRLFSVDRLSLHLSLVAILATFIGLVIFLIAAMDNPYRGEFSVSPEPFQILLDGMMKVKK